MPTGSWLRSGRCEMATIRSKYYTNKFRLNRETEEKIEKYLDSLPVGAVCCSAELKELVYGYVPKERMQLFERACKDLMLSHGFEYIEKPYTIEYKRQRCYQKTIDLTEKRKV